MPRRLVSSPSRAVTPCNFSQLRLCTTSRLDPVRDRGGRVHIRRLLGTRAAVDDLALTREPIQILGPADRIGVPHLRCPPETTVAAGCGGASKNVSPTGAGSAAGRSSSLAAADLPNRPARSAVTGSRFYQAIETMLNREVYPPGFPKGEVPRGRRHRCSMPPCRTEWQVTPS
jgi:hypothetical protein